MSLIAHYPLNGDTLDYSGNGYHGTIYGAVTTSTIGKIGSCHVFTNNSYIKTTSTPTVNSNMTFAAWIYPTDLGTGTTGQTIKGILSNHNHPSFANATLFLYGSSLRVEFGFTDDTRSAGLNAGTVVVNVAEPPDTTPPAAIILFVSKR